MEPAGDFAARALTAPTHCEMSKARRPAAPFPATRPRSVYDAKPNRLAFKRQRWGSRARIPRSQARGCATAPAGAGAACECRFAWRLLHKGLSEAVKTI